MFGRRRRPLLFPLCVLIAFRLSQTRTTCFTFQGRFALLPHHKVWAFSTRNEPLNWHQIWSEQAGESSVFPLTHLPAAPFNTAEQENLTFHISKDAQLQSGSSSLSLHTGLLFIFLQQQQQRPRAEPSCFPPSLFLCSTAPCASFYLL